MAYNFNASVYCDFNEALDNKNQDKECEENINCDKVEGIEVENITEASHANAVNYNDEKCEENISCDKAEGSEVENIVEECHENNENPGHHEEEETSDVDSEVFVNPNGNLSIKRKTHIDTPSVRRSSRLTSFAKQSRRENASRGFVSVEKKPQLMKKKFNKTRRKSKKGSKVSDSSHTAKSGSSEEVFVQSLRSYDTTSVTSAQHKGATKIEPFNLHENKTRQESKKFVSMAEMNNKFYATPERFRTKPASAVKASDDGEAATKRRKLNNGEVRATIPHTPNLIAGNRKRKTYFLSQQERDELEVLEAKKQAVKPLSLNKKIFDPPALPIKQTKKVTIPKPFDIVDAKRTHCQPTPSLNTSVTTEQSGVRFTEKKEPTKPTPFSFEERDKKNQENKKRKIQQIIEEEKEQAVFHANPMPHYQAASEGVIPKKIKPTVPEPFNLKGEKISEEQRKKIAENLEAMKREEEERRKFTSRPPASIINDPFVPKPSEKPLTQFEEFGMNSEKRAEERQKFDEHLKEREDLIKARKIELEQRAKEKEEEEIKQLRKNAEHKANPVKKFVPVVVQKGLIPPTVPKTPQFATERLKVRRNTQDSVHDSVSTQIDGVSTQIDSVSAQIDGVSTQIDSVSTQIDSVSTQIDTVSTQIDSVSTQIDSVNSQIDGEGV